MTIPVHLLISSLLGGVVLGVLAAALVAVRQVGWGSIVGYFIIGGVGLFGLTIGQLLRSLAPTPGWMDLALRTSQGFALIASLGISEVFRRSAKEPLTRPYKILLFLLALTAALCFLSPGGLLFEEVTGIRRHMFPWGEEINVPIAAVSPGFVLEIGIVSIVFCFSTRFAWLRVRRDTSIQGIVMVTAMAASWGVIARILWNAANGIRGPVYAEFVILSVFLSATLEAIKFHRTWAEERNSAMERLARSEEMLAALAGHGQTLAGLLDREGRLVHANQRALKFLGKTFPEIVGVEFVKTSWWSHSEVLQKRLTLGIERALGGEPDRFQATHPSSEGPEINVDFSLTPFRDSEGKVKWLIAEGRDVTELVRYEERSRAEQRLEVIGQLAGGVAHDFNNMLSGIMGATELARAESTEPEVQENLTLVLSAAERAAGLTKQLLHFARRGGTRHENYSLHDLLQATVKLFERTSGNAARVDISFEASIDRTLGDPTMMQSAILNLLVNARDAMPNGGTITLRTCDEVLTESELGGFSLPVDAGQHIRLTVEDVGSGISPEILSKIFEPFFTTKEIGKGTGLGLAAVLSCVRDHKGTVEVKSQVGQGTQFLVHLPVFAEATEHESQFRVYAPAHAKGRTALLVDDEPIVRNSMTRMLKHLGYRVTSEEDPLLALERTTDPPDVALLDFHMPGMNGADLASALRQRFPTLPIVIMSGNFGDRYLDELKRDPKTRLLAKPARREELVGVLLELEVITPRAADKKS